MASSLQDLWKTGKEGCLSPLEQCRAWALREVYREQDVPEKKLYTMMAAKLTKIGGGAPTPRAVLKLFEKVDGDEDWFPGKVEEGRGRKPALTGLAKSVIQRSAEAIRRRGGEPTYNLICGTCPEAVKNPETQQAVGKKRVYDVFHTQCYDDGADQPWTNRARLTKTALPEFVIEHRLRWLKYMQGLPHTDEWYYRNLIWVDICNDIIPTTERKATRMAQARKGGKGWMSPGNQIYSRNLKGDKTHLKQKGSDTYKVFWMPVLMRGKLHVEVFSADFPGESPDGAEVCAQKLGPILNIRFPNHQCRPKIVMSDKGCGFYHGTTSVITDEWKAGLRSVGLKPFMGDNAQVQSGQMGDVLLHETSVSWIRAKLVQNSPARPWEETREQFKSRMQEVCRQINAEFDVEGLCRKLPKRLQQLKDREGDRLKQ